MTAPPTWSKILLPIQPLSEENPPQIVVKMNTFKLPKLARPLCLSFCLSFCLSLFLSPAFLLADETSSAHASQQTYKKNGEPVAGEAQVAPRAETIKRAGVAFGTAAIALSDVSAADLSFSGDVLGVYTNGALQGYEVSTSEFFLKDRLTGDADIETLAEPVGSAEEMRQLVLAEDGIWGQDCMLVLYALGQPHNDENRRFLSHKLEVKIDTEGYDFEGDPGAMAAASARLHELADAAGVVVSREISLPSGTAILHATCGGSAVKVAAMLSHQPGVKVARPMLVTPQVKCSLPNDEFFTPTNQYYVHDMPPPGRPSLLVWPVWCGFFPLQQRYFGRGVDISLLDDGVQGDHPDLDHAYDYGNDTDFVDGDNDGGAEGNNNHGTEMAGIVVARHNNGGIAGIAPASEIWSTRVFGASDPQAPIDAHEHKDTIVEIVLLGFTAGGNFVDISEALEDAFENLAERKDVAVVYPAGGAGGGAENDFDRASSHRHTIAVGAIAGPSEEGCNIVCAGPGVEMTTTDRTGEDGDDASDYMFDFGGTSGAAAGVAGVIALMQDARPDLGWRDIQEILLLSSRACLPSAANGFGFFVPLPPGDFTFLPYKFNYTCGGGLATGLIPDPLFPIGAVSLAEVWPLLPDGIGYKSIAKTSTFPSTRNRDIGDETQHFVFDLANVTPSMRIEHMEVTLEWEPADNGQAFADLTPVDVVLVSPYYCTADDRPFAMSSILGTKENGVNAPTKWTYTTNRHWGMISDGGFQGRIGWPGNPSREMGSGEWELELSIAPTDTKPTRKLERATLTVYGIEDNLPPFVISANISSSGNPGVIAPRTAFVDEDLSVDDAVFFDSEGDELTVDIQWEKLDEDGLTWVPAIPASTAPANCDFDEYTLIKTTDDENSGYDGRYFIVYDATGASVAFWFRMSFSTPIPPGAAAADRSFAINGVLPNEGAAGIAADIAAAVLAEGTFGLGVPLPPPLGCLPPLNNEVLITHPTGTGDVRDADPGTMAVLAEISREVSQDDVNGNCFTTPGTTITRLDASFTETETKYRAVITPKDKLRDGFRFITPQIIVNSRPVRTGAFRTPYFYDADLWIETVPPEDLDPFGFINEVSQGTGDNTTNTEWVEIMMNYSTDMRGFRLANDISTFDVVFTQHPIWEEVQYGTMIVVNGDDRDPLLPPETPLADFGTTDVWVISSSNSDLFNLPDNDNGWGEFSNRNCFPAGGTPPYSGITNRDFCDPVPGAHVALQTRFAARNAIQWSLVQRG